MIAYGCTLTGSVFVVHMTRQTPPYDETPIIKSLCGVRIGYNVSTHKPMGDRRLCKRCVRLLRKEAA